MADHNHRNAHSAGDRPDFCWIFAGGVHPTNRACSCCIAA
jgi:hypothetical protein